MAQTLSVTHNQIRNVAIVSFIDTGTVAATEIEVGFRPRLVRVINETSRDMMEWFEGMTNGHGVKTVAAGTRTKVTSNGITVSDTSFTIGLDTDVLVTSEQLRIEVIG